MSSNNTAEFKFSTWPIILPGSSWSLQRYVVIAANASVTSWQHQSWIVANKKLFSLACVLGPCDLKRIWILARSYSIIFHHLPARTNHPIELEVMFILPCSWRSSRCWRVKDIFFCPSNPGSPHGRFIPTHFDTLRHMFAALRSTTLQMQHNAIVARINASQRCNTADSTKTVQLLHCQCRWRNWGKRALDHCWSVHVLTFARPRQFTPVAPLHKYEESCMPCQAQKPFIHWYDSECFILFSARWFF